MAVGFPAKTTYANGDVFSASDINDTNGTLNLLGSSVAYAAGKNKIINGDFFFNQRAFTSTTTTNTYGFDRFIFTTVDGTGTYSAQTFTLGTAPVVGYEGKNFARVASTGQTLTSAQTLLSQRIESVRTFANQTATVSFWAKSGSGTPKVAVELVQRFGTGGSPSSNVNTYGAQVTLSTSWTRYTVTFTVPSISGKTLGTANDDNLALNLWTSAGSDFNSRTGSLGIQTTTIDFWGVQVEAGSTATAFQTATGTIQGELAACQRYYWRWNATDNSSAVLAGGSIASSSIVYVALKNPITMRVKPTSLDVSTMGVSDFNLTYSGGTFSLGALGSGGDYTTILYTHTAATMVQYRPAYLIANSSTSAYFGLSSEL
jgi:hypothetical protein